MINREGQIVMPDKRGFFKLDGSRYLKSSAHKSIEPRQGAAPKDLYNLIGQAFGDRGRYALGFLVASWFVNQIKTKAAD